MTTPTQEYEHIYNRVFAVRVFYASIEIIIKGITY